MRTIGRALAFDLFRRHRWGLGVVAAYGPALVFIRAVVLPDLTLADELQFAFTVSIPLSAALFYLLVVFTFGADGDLGGRASLFPRRLLTLPVSTSALTGWYVLLCTTTFFALWVVTWFTAVRPTGVDLPFLWPGLYTASFAAWMQALTWMPYGLPMLRVVVTVAWLTAGDIAAILSVQYQVDHGLMTALVLPQIPLAYLVARAAVARARRGDVPDWAAGLRRRRADAAVARPPFASATRAQLWFEWHRHGRALPTLVAILVPCELLLLLASRDTPVMANTLVLLAALTPAAIAPFVAATVRRSGGTASDAHRLTTFEATRPLSSAALVAPKLVVAAISTALACALVAVMVPAALALTDTGYMVRAAWDALRAVIGPPRAVALAVLVGVLLVLTTWKHLVQSLYVGLSGRPWLVRTYMTLMLIVLFAILPVFSWARRGGLIATLWDHLWWIAGIAVIVKLGTAAWLALALERRALLTARTLLAGAVAWLVAVLALHATLVWFLDSPFVPAGLLLACAILAVPLTRLSAAPLALAANRHR